MKRTAGLGSLAALAMVGAVMASPDGIRRMAAAAQWRRDNPEIEPEKVLTDLDRAQLDLAAEKRERKRKARMPK